MSPALRLLPPLLAAAALALFLGSDVALDAGELRLEVPPESNGAHVLRAAHGDAAPAVLVGRPRVPEAAPDAATLGKALIEVVDADGPCRNVRVFVFGLRSEVDAWGDETDRQGRVELEDVPYDGSVSVLVDGLPESDPDADATRAVRVRAAIRGPLTRIRIAATMPLEIRFRDVETGRALPGVSYRLLRDEAQFRTTSPRRMVRAKPDGYCSVWTRPDTPHGYAGLDGLWFTGTLSRRARAVRMEATLRHEAEVYLHATDTSGRAVTDAEAVDAEVAGQTVSGVTSVPGRGNLLRVHGIPFLRGEGVRVLAARPDGTTESNETDVDAADIEVDSGLPYLLPEEMWDGSACYRAGFAAIAGGDLPAHVGESLVLTAVFDPAIRIRSVQTDRFMGHSDGFYGRDKVPEGRVVLLVLDRDGNPARGVEVGSLNESRRTDLDGRAVFAKVPEGDRYFVLREPGWVKTVHGARIRGGETNQVTLRESEGCELLVRVVAAEDGVPLTGARIEVSDWCAWVDLEDGVQRLDVATNHKGERLLRRFPTGPAKVRATWGRRDGKALIDVQGGARQTLEIRLPKVDAP